jgi:hypothetical protein
MTNISTFPGDTQGRNILKSRTITHGTSSSGEVDTYTLNPGENLIILNNHQGSAGSSRTYAANFTAGIPTALGTVLHLEINSSRTNNSGSQILHRTAIQFGGTAYLDTGNIAVYATGNAQDAYQRKLQRTIVLTVSGWVDFSLGSRVGGDTLATDIIFKTNENVGQAATGSDSADVERMRITNTGNVGIGVQDPGTRFAVQSGGDTKLRITSATTGNSVLEMGDPDDYDAGRIDYDNNNNWMSIYTAGGNRMRISDAGYTTIGAYVQSPRFTLDIPAHYSPDTLGLVIHGGSGAANNAGDGGIGFNAWYSKQGCKVGIINHAVSWGRGNLHFCNKNTAGSGAQGDRVAYADSRMTVGYGGYVGIGTNNPVSRFNVWQSSDNSPTGSFLIHAANSTFGYWGQYITAANDYMFHRNGGDRGYLAGNGNAYQIDFTGQHRSFIDGISVTNYADFEGLVVSANKNKYYDIDENVTTGANAIQISQSLPLVALSNVAHDKACFGVISGVEDPDTRKYEQGTFVSVFQKQKGDTRAFINSLGEGAIWVTNIGGNLEAGDYITTSNVAGYGQKQDSEFLANYTVAKITMDCDFEPVTQPIQIIRKEMGDANYWVKTTYETISEEEYSNLIEENRRTVTETVYTNENNEISVGEYSNLESNIQSTYSELTETLYQNITKEESKTEREGYELEVRQEIVNVLDEHGQIQWEDHATETEKAYKIRYLDANGVITDEANIVHTAAFVGCTYHCG